MIRTSDTIMFLLKDRNASYYARYYFSKELVGGGFPPELRFSLSTKQRAIAKERMIAVISAIQIQVSQFDTLKPAKEQLSELKGVLSDMRTHGFKQNSVATTSKSKFKKPVTRPKKKKSPTQSNYQRHVDEFLKGKSAERISLRSVNQLKLRLGRFFTFVRKFDVQEVSPKDGMAFKQYLLEEGSSEKTTNEYLAANRQFYSWLKIQEVIKVNPLDNIKVKKKSQQAFEERSRWSHSQLKHLFCHENFKDHKTLKSGKKTIQSQLEDYWIPLLLLHTGARSAEICQLDTADILQVDGHWCISINDDGDNKTLKSLSARRIVPLHSKLIELGFVDYVQNRIQRREKKLFSLNPIGMYNDWGKQFAQRFQRVLKSQGFVGNSRRTLHGLRHTFVDELKQVGVDEHIVAQLIGHTTKGITFGRYGKTASIENLSMAVEKLDVAVLCI